MSSGRNRNRPLQPEANTADKKPNYDRFAVVPVDVESEKSSDDGDDDDYIAISDHSNASPSPPQPRAMTMRKSTAEDMDMDHDVNDSTPTPTTGFDNGNVINLNNNLSNNVNRKEKNGKKTIAEVIQSVQREHSARESQRIKRRSQLQEEDEDDEDISKKLYNDDKVVKLEDDPKEKSSDPKDLFNLGTGEDGYIPWDKLVENTSEYNHGNNFPEVKFDFVTTIKDDETKKAPSHNPVDKRSSFKGDPTAGGKIKKENDLDINYLATQTNKSETTSKTAIPEIIVSGKAEDFPVVTGNAINSGRLKLLSPSSSENTNKALPRNGSSVPKKKSRKPMNMNVETSTPTTTGRANKAMRLSSLLRDDFNDEGDDAAADPTGDNHQNSIGNDIFSDSSYEVDDTLIKSNKLPNALLKAGQRLFSNGDGNSRKQNGNPKITQEIEIIPVDSKDEFNLKSSLVAASKTVMYAHERKMVEEESRKLIIVPGNDNMNPNMTAPKADTLQKTLRFSDSMEIFTFDQQTTKVEASSMVLRPFTYVSADKNDDIELNNSLRDNRMSNRRMPRAANSKLEMMTFHTRLKEELFGILGTDQERKHIVDKITHQMYLSIEHAPNKTEKLNAIASMIKSEEYKRFFFVYLTFVGLSTMASNKRLHKLCSSKLMGTSPNHGTTYLRMVFNFLMSIAGLLPSDSDPDSNSSSFSEFLTTPDISGKESYLEAFQTDLSSRGISLGLDNDILKLFKKKLYLRIDVSPASSLSEGNIEGIAANFNSAFDSDDSKTVIGEPILAMIDGTFRDLMIKDIHSPAAVVKSLPKVDEIFAPGLVVNSSIAQTFEPNFPARFDEMLINMNLPLFLSRPLRTMIDTIRHFCIAFSAAQSICLKLSMLNANHEAFDFLSDKIEYPEFIATTLSSIHKKNLQEEIKLINNNPSTLSSVASVDFESMNLNMNVNGVATPGQVWISAIQESHLFKLDSDEDEKEIILASCYHPLLSSLCRADMYFSRRINQVGCIHGECHGHRGKLLLLLIHMVTAYNTNNDDTGEIDIRKSFVEKYIDAGYSANMSICGEGVSNEPVLTISWSGIGLNNLILENSNELNMNEKEWHEYYHSVQSALSVKLVGKMAPIHHSNLISALRSVWDSRFGITKVTRQASVIYKKLSPRTRLQFNFQEFLKLSDENAFENDGFINLKSIYPESTPFKVALECFFSACSKLQRKAAFDVVQLLAESDSSLPKIDTLNIISYASEYMYQDYLLDKKIMGAIALKNSRMVHSFPEQIELYYPEALPLLRTMISATLVIGNEDNEKENKEKINVVLTKVALVSALLYGDYDIFRFLLPLSSDPGPLFAAELLQVLLKHFLTSLNKRLDFASTINIFRGILYLITEPDFKNNKIKLKLTEFQIYILLTAFTKFIKLNAFTSRDIELYNLAKNFLDVPKVQLFLLQDKKTMTTKLKQKFESLKLELFYALLQLNHDNSSCLLMLLKTLDLSNIETDDVLVFLLDLLSHKPSTPTLNFIFDELLPRYRILRSVLVDAFFANYPEGGYQRYSWMMRYLLFKRGQLLSFERRLKFLENFLSVSPLESKEEQIALSNDYNDYRMLDASDVMAFAKLIEDFAADQYWLGLSMANANLSPSNSKFSFSRSRSRSAKRGPTGADGPTLVPTEFIEFVGFIGSYSTDIGDHVPRGGRASSAVVSQVQGRNIWISGLRFVAQTLKNAIESQPPKLTIAFLPVSAKTLASSIGVHEDQARAQSIANAKAVGVDSSGNLAHELLIRCDMIIFDAMDFPASFDVRNSALGIVKIITDSRKKTRQSSVDISEVDPTNRLLG